MSDSKKSPWQQYKEKLGDTRPWDLLNPNTEYASEEEASARFDICKACPELIDLTKQCKQCGCIMSLKTKLALATCPLGKWGAVETQQDII